MGKIRKKLWKWVKTGKFWKIEWNNGKQLPLQWCVKVVFVGDGAQGVGLNGP